MKFKAAQAFVAKMRQENDDSDGSESDDSEMYHKPGDIESDDNESDKETGLEVALEQLRSTHGWVEHLDVTAAPLEIPKPLQQQMDAETNSEVLDDFKREMRIYQQAQAAVLEALPKLQDHGISTKRPEDYFAEMLKSDKHMEKVRERLVAKKIGLERSEKAKRLRELRKYGKKVQVEVQQQRHKEKRELLEQISKARRGKIDKLNFLQDDKKGGPKQQQHKKGKKREFKDKKFGFGGQKKRSKYNTASSAADVSDFSGRKHSTRPGKKIPKSQKGKNANKRPGKSVRLKKRNTNKRK